MCGNPPEVAEGTTGEGAVSGEGSSKGTLAPDGLHTAFALRSGVRTEPVMEKLGDRTRSGDGAQRRGVRGGMCGRDLQPGRRTGVDRRARPVNAGAAER